MMRYRLIEHNSDEQMNWDRCDDTREYLTEGEVYVAEVETHNWHTKLVIDDRRFNSVCFEEVEGGREE